MQKHPIIKKNFTLTTYRVHIPLLTSAKQPFGQRVFVILRPSRYFRFPPKALRNALGLKVRERPAP
jgi:hypothetical protein